MSAPMRKRLTSGDMIDCFTKQGAILRLPSHIANKYVVSKGTSKKANSQLKCLLDNESIDASVFFKEMDRKYTEAGALLRGTRHRERLSQKVQK